VTVHANGSYTQNVSTIIATAVDLGVLFPPRGKSLAPLRVLLSLVQKRIHFISERKISNVFAT